MHIWIAVFLVLLSAGAALAEPLQIQAAPAAGEQPAAEGQAGSQNAKPLQGHVEEKGQKPLQGRTQTNEVLRVPRPLGASLTPKAEQNLLHTGIDSQNFQLSGSANEQKPLQSETATMAAPIDNSSLFGHTKTEAPPRLLTGTSVPVSQPPVKEGGGGGGAAPTNNYGEYKPPEKKKQVLIRLKRFRSQLEMEVCWEAAYTANNMLKQGYDVTMLFDWEAVHAALKGDTNFTEYEPYRGNGNQNSTGKMISIQGLLRRFTEGGGTLLVSERWAKIYGYNNAQGFTAGTRLVDDDEFAKILAESSNILDY